MNDEWAGGYIEAKGCFTFNRVVTKTGIYRNPVFFLTQKERDPLFLLQEITGLGEVKKAGGLFRWEVRKKGEVVKLMEFLEGKIKTPVRLRQYEEWKKGVLQWKQRGTSKIF